MLQTILILSPLIVLFLSGLAIFVIGLRRYLFRKDKRNVDPNERTATAIAFGTIALAVSGSVLLFALTLSRILLFALFLCGSILFLVGGVTLRKRVLAGKEYIYSLSATSIGMTFIATNFPFLVNLREPFTLVYGFAILMVVSVQVVVLASWIKKRKQENSISFNEQEREE